MSDFRDRIVHHALVNILQPIFEPRFIHDSYASRRGKGTFAALNRFDEFKRKVAQRSSSGGASRRVFVLKADIRHYFDTVDHETLIGIIERRVRDDDILWLIQSILENYDSGTHGKGMPLGNWTSQFFANVYLNELDQFVKHEFKAEFYIRYVDDFLILHHSWKRLESYRDGIETFLRSMNLELHPTKCAITPLCRGVGFLGFRVFSHFRIPRRRNVRKIKARLQDLLSGYESGQVEGWEVLASLIGWFGYAMQGNTYRLRRALEIGANQRLCRSRSMTYSDCLPFRGRASTSHDKIKRVFLSPNP